MATVAAANDSNRPPIMQPSQALFEAVARRDYVTLADLYADNARRTIVSFLSMRNRWNPFVGLEKSEEKCNEYLQQITSEGYNESILGYKNEHSNAGNSRMVDDFPYHVALRDLGIFLQGDDDSDKRASKKTRQQMDCRAHANSNDLDRLLWDSATIHSDSRPPSNFVVYNSRGDRQPRGRDDGPPIFDGSVANATPPPLGGPATGPSGGSGTILHLACALDSPLALAFLMAMGADARTSHTAFRRLMIHEAACNGSIECLSLLLELGQACARGEDFPPAGRRTSQELSFLAGKLEQQQQQHREEMARNDIHRFHNFFGSPSLPTKDLAKGDFVQFLRLFREYNGMVQAGVISEINAARSILAHATLTHASRVSLARSCTFSRTEAEMPRTILRPHGGCADGHGNTPLHWAAFKNETECVALLLAYNADANARAYPSGWTPLHDAAYSNSSESIALLIDAGAHVDARANSGATPLCFAAQEDAADAALLLLNKGADLATRCAGGPMRDSESLFGAQLSQLANHHHPHSRFSGYSPLHYCSHYNAHNAARVLLKHPSAKSAMEIPDLSERLPIHVAVARGSSDVLRELLHAGARVEIPRSKIAGALAASPRRARSVQAEFPAIGAIVETPARHPIAENERDPISPTGSNVSAGSASSASAPVSSPVLRAMIPSQPITSSKPWNCLTQRSIDECRDLILHAEKNWAPSRHTLFTPADRRAVLELLRVGKRLELQGTGIFTDLWPLVLSFCGRGWFEVESADSAECMIGIEQECPSDEEDDALMLPVFNQR